LRIIELTLNPVVEEGARCYPAFAFQLLELSADLLAADALYNKLWHLT